MTDIFNVSRRDFMRTGLLAGGGLVLGLHLPAPAKGQKLARKEGPFALNAFVRVGSDDSVSVVVNHSEMGQGIYTSMPMVIAEELDADWAKVRFEAAPVAAVYNHPIYGAQLTGGSSSTWVEWERVRKAGAAARAMLIRATAPALRTRPRPGAAASQAGAGRWDGYRRLRPGRLKPTFAASSSSASASLCMPWPEMIDDGNGSSDPTLQRCDGPHRSWPAPGPSPAVQAPPPSIRRKIAAAAINVGRYTRLRGPGRPRYLVRRSRARMASSCRHHRRGRFSCGGLP